MSAHVRPGDLVRIPEAHYRYGVGDLVLKVGSVGQVQRLDDEDWLMVVGTQIAWNGAELGERQVLVRLAGLDQ